MSSLAEMKQLRVQAIAKAESIVAAAESGNRALTDAENTDFDAATAESSALTSRIASVEKLNTLRMNNPNGIIPGAPGATRVGQNGGPKNRVLGEDYRNAFQAFLLSGGERVDAALYEGQGSAGGYAVPVEVEGQIVPLAPPETGIRKLATVLNTTNDIRVPRQIAASTAASKAESGATVNNFVETGPSLDQFTLSAFMAGAFVKMSFELAPDVPAFQAFAVSDLLNAQQQVEEGWFVSGSGVNQAQGMLGNVGAGVTEEPDALGNPVSIDGTLDLIGTLNAAYLENASFLMNRGTSVLIRKAQRQANLFEPVWTRSNGVDYLHGFPVQYSAAMPVAARSASPLLFGDFKQGYTIGDRGGSGINVKVLDQPFALQGQIALLAFRRTDGRVRRPQALQQYNVAASYRGPASAIEPPTPNRLGRPWYRMLP